MYNEAGRRYFTKQTLVNAMSFFMDKCFFTVGNMLFKQDIGIPMGIDQAPYCANLFLYFLESKYTKKLTLNGSSKTQKYHGVSRFIGNLYVVNDDNEFRVRAQR